MVREVGCPDCAMTSREARPHLVKSPQGHLGGPGLRMAKMVYDSLYFMHTANK